MNPELSGRSPRQEATPDLSIVRSAVHDVCLLTVHGVLNATTYIPLRDAIVKAALDEPNSLVVDITALVVRDDPALAVFTSARWQVSEWPDTPMGLVCTDEHRLRALRRNAITRYVPVYSTLPAAIDDLAAGVARRYRRRVSAKLPPVTSSAATSRQLVTEWLAVWSRTDFTRAVSVIATELVELVLADTDGPLRLRLESDGSTVAVAVQYARRARTMRRNPVDDMVSELDLIAGSCRAWGNHSGEAGETVWVVLGPENRF